MMRSRIATVLTVLGLVGGSGGALAMAQSAGAGSGGSAAGCQYGNRYHDCDHGKIEKQPFVVRHCEKIHWHSQNCKVERREIRQCKKSEKKRSKEHCWDVAAPIRR